jgi:hypothetical protein
MKLLCGTREKENLQNRDSNPTYPGGLGPKMHGTDGDCFYRIERAHRNWNNMTDEQRKRFPAKMFNNVDTSLLANYMLMKYLSVLDV